MLRRKHDAVQPAEAEVALGNGRLEPARERDMGGEEQRTARRALGRAPHHDIDIGGIGGEQGLPLVRDVG